MRVLPKFISWNKRFNAIGVALSKRNPILITSL